MCVGGAARDRPYLPHGDRILCFFMHVNQNFKNISFLCKNEKEIQRLCEALPNTEILLGNGRVENKSEIPWWKRED